MQCLTHKASPTACLEGGLLLLLCSVHGNVFRCLFPLTIEPAVLDEELDILEHAPTHGTVAQA
jgi:4-aminobutyrate aminotransferase-like enzyme